MAQSVPNSFTAGTTAAAGQVNQNFQTVLGSNFRLLGSDINGSTIVNTTSETMLSQIIYVPSGPAGSAWDRLLIFAGVRFDTGSPTSGELTYGSFIVRTGVSATPTSNTLRKSIVLAAQTTANDSDVIVGGFLASVVDSTQETLTGSVYVHITGSMNKLATNIRTVCDYVFLFGV